MLSGKVDPNRFHLEQVPTHVAGLDVILRGGLIRGGSYLILGGPGTGKTTLGNQIAFAQARDRHVVVFATVLGESHARMLAHLARFDFFEPEAVGDTIHYLSIFDELTEGGLDGILTLLRRTVRQSGASLLVIDGASLFAQFGDATSLGVFINKLHVLMSGLNCTLILLSNETLDVRRSPISTHVDGIIELSLEEFAPRDVRFVHVLKIRGVSYIEGDHQMQISKEGIQVFPRLEALADGMPTEVHGRVPIGIPGLDDMLHGGVLPGSMTLIMGSAGAGKTLSGLHFLTEGARNGERGLWVGFHETPPRLRGKAEALGLPFGQYADQGLIEVLWEQPREILLDEWAHKVLNAVETFKPQRLMIDAITDLTRQTVFTGRLPSFLISLSNALRARNVTTIMSAGGGSFFGSEIISPIPSISATVENILLLRYVEIQSQLRRLVSIIKVRESDYDTTIRQYLVTDKGMVVTDPFPSGEGILTGTAYQVDKDIESEKRDKAQ